jgi:hypothetical protein
MEEWDHNDWQGRSQQNVNYSYKTTVYALLSILVVAAIYLSYIAST